MLSQDRSVRPKTLPPEVAPDITSKEPAKVTLNNVTEDEFIAIVEQLQVDIPTPVLYDIFSDIKNDKPPVLSGLLDGIPCSGDFHLAAGRVWECGRRKLRTWVEAAIYNDDTSTDRAHASVTLRKTKNEAPSLEIAWEEEMLRAQSLQYNRSNFLTDALKAAHEAGQVPGKNIDREPARVEFNLKKPDPAGLNMLRDPHLASRRELLLSVLGGDGQSPEGHAINIMIKILGGMESGSVTWGYEPGSTLKDQFKSLRDLKGAPSLSFIYHDRLILPVGPATTLEALESDYKSLAELRAQIKKEEPDPKFVAPTTMFVHAPEAKEALAVANCAGLQLHDGLVEQIYQNMLQGKNFDPDMLFELATKPDAILLSSCEVAQYEKGESADIDKYFIVEMADESDVPILSLIPVYQETQQEEDNDSENEEQDEEDEDSDVMDADGEYEELEDGEEEEEEDDEERAGSALDMTQRAGDQPVAINLRLTWKTTDVEMSSDLARTRWGIVDRISIITRRPATPRGLFYFFDEPQSSDSPEEASSSMPKISLVAKRLMPIGRLSGK